MITAEAVLDAAGLAHEPSGHLWGHWVDTVDDLGDISRVHVELPVTLMDAWIADVALETSRFGPLPSPPDDHGELLQRCAELVEEACSAGSSAPVEVRLEQIPGGKVRLTAAHHRRGL